MDWRCSWKYVHSDAGSSSGMMPNAGLEMKVIGVSMLEVELLEEGGAVEEGKETSKL